MSNQTIAKYQTIKEAIKKQIERGELREGDRLPSDAQFCQTYQVSRITVTRAIHDLVAEGLLYRIRGKGTFVKDEVITEGVLKLSGFTERMRQQNLDLQTQLIKRDWVLIPEKMATYFGLNPDLMVIRLKRMRIVNGKPFCLSVSYLMPDVFYWVLVEDMEVESLYDCLEHKYALKLGDGQQRIQVDYLIDQDAKLFSMDQDQPFLKLSLYCFLTDGRPAQFEESFYVGSRYVYEMQLKREMTKP
ncbi:GntR family transcriptional regulator [Gottschalkiaceae bacterium SANA]|nr:GntR family transcriptional regulator [Gottschalkiaceae bacterium SANA]